MNIKLRTEAKNDFEEDFFKLMNNAFLGKTMENGRKHRDIKIVTTDKRRNKLASEPTYHKTKYFSETFMAIEMQKKTTKVKMNNSIDLGMPILYISKTVMYEFWYDYMKPKYHDEAKLCYMDTGNFIIHIKAEYFNEDIAIDVEKWFDISNYDEKDKRPLPIGKNKNVIGLFKDELGGRIMKEFVGLRAKIYAYLLDDDTEYKKAKGKKKCENYKDLCLKVIKIACLMIKSY